MINQKALTERDICTKYITPAIENAGWDILTQVREEFMLTKGRVIVRGKLHTHTVGDGMQQALNYAGMLQAPFVFSSNGDAFLFHNSIATDGVVEKEIGMSDFPAPEELWRLWSVEKGMTPAQEHIVTQDYYSEGSNKAPRSSSLCAMR